MKKYISFFRLRFSMSLQYRTAALAGLATQFAWGIMEVLVYRAFYESDASAFPMSLQATCSYIWLQQAFFALLTANIMENDIFNAIVDGSVAYELCRPLNIYDMWFARSCANRAASGLMRCLPVLLFAAVLPAPYGLGVPAGRTAVLLFPVTLVLGLLVNVSLCMLIYMLSFFTVSAMGLRMFFIALAEFCQGAVIPLPFFPDGIRWVLELLPFSAVQNVPLLIYSGTLTGNGMLRAIFLQLFWLAALTAAGKGLCFLATNKITVQGG